MREQTVEFKLIRKNETKKLRGVIYLGENETPTLQHFEEYLRRSGYDVTLDNAEEAVFKAFEKGEPILIDIMEEKLSSERTRDPQAEALARSFIKKDPSL
ncbi:hypothetical protein [Paenibacillus turpanensis]|uniref:hypothetical protein n=1 Tax=Paenibacillus turpanensis TaxID=2689078 RepID=UPI001407DDC0|nr:hypothetical protein [Paenibacillus turpanensis]